MRLRKLPELEKTLTISGHCETSDEPQPDRAGVRAAAAAEPARAAGAEHLGDDLVVAAHAVDDLEDAAAGLGRDLVARAERELVADRELAGVLLAHELAAERAEAPDRERDDADGGEHDEPARVERAGEQPRVAALERGEAPFAPGVEARVGAATRRRRAQQL